MTVRVLGGAIAATVLVLAIGSATAQAARPAVDDCSAATTQVAINACTSRRAAAAARRENAEYAASIAAATGRRRALIVAAERAWRAYRDANCSAVGELFAGGSVQPSVILGCHARHDAARADELVRQRTAESAM